MRGLSAYCALTFCKSGHGDFSCLPVVMLYGRASLGVSAKVQRYRYFARILDTENHLYILLRKLLARCSESQRSVFISRVIMFNLGNNRPFGGQRNNRFGGSNYQYQTLASPMSGVQTSSLVSKVMALLATSFLVATVGAFIGMNILGFGGYFVVIIAGFITLLLLYAMINVQGLNLFLLFLFIFLEGLGLGPLVGAYLGTGNGYILGQAFLITAITSFSLAIYAWTTKRNFARLGDYLFVGVILLLITSLIGIFFNSVGFSLIIAFFGVAIFSGYILYYVQRAKYMADTLPNAIGLTVSLFLTLMNLFLYILEILTIVNGGGNRRR